MQRLSQLVLCVCLFWALLLTTGQAETDEDYEADGTAIPDYEFNTTFHFSFYSNVSTLYEDLSKYFQGGEYDTEEGPDEVPVTEDTQDTTRDTANCAPRTTPLSLLLGMGLLVHRLCGHL